MNTEKLRNIKMVIFDVDGVLSDGKIILDNNGVETKNFDVHDGQGIVYLHRVGIKTAIITGRDVKIVDIRAKELGITEVFQGARFKNEALDIILKKHKLSKDEICYMGDDFPDLLVMRHVGFAVAVKNARPELKKIAHYTTKAMGGRGAAREVCEMILKAQGHWKTIMARYE